MKRVLIYIFLVPTLFVVIGSLCKNFVLDTPLVRSSEAAADKAERSADESEKALDKEQRRIVLAQPSPISSPDTISPFSSPTSIYTEEQLEARDRTVLKLQQIKAIALQQKEVVKRISDSGEKIKACEQHALSTKECLSAKMSVLQAQSEFERLNQQSQELLKKAKANMCIVNPSRSGC